MVTGVAERMRLELQDAASKLLPPPPLFLLQPLLARIVRCVAEKHPGLFERLGPHQSTRFIIDPTNLPFVLYLVACPDDLVLRACQRSELPAHDAHISSTLSHLLRLLDSSGDGDAMFFSRDLEISGNTEAVVRLRNALDDVDGSVALAAADALGPPGRLALAFLRKFSGEPATSGASIK